MPTQTVEYLADLLNVSDENSLEHYGRLGMKWGQHIFGKDEESKAERAAKKVKKKRERALKKARARKIKLDKAKQKETKFLKENRDKILRNPKLLKKYQYHFSDEEVFNALRRFDYDSRLANVQLAKIERGRRAVENLSGFAKSSINTYNSLARTYNSFTNDPNSKLKIIQTEDKKKDKNKNKDKNEDDDD